MKRIYRHITLGLFFAGAAFTAAASAHAKPPSWSDMMSAQPKLTQSFVPEERRSRPQWAQNRVSASQAKAIALRRYPGAEVADISLTGDTYRVRLILRNGQVKDVYIDAITGRAR